MAGDLQPSTHISSQTFQIYSQNLYKFGPYFCFSPVENKNTDQSLEGNLQRSGFQVWQRWYRMDSLQQMDCNKNREVISHSNRQSKVSLGVTHIASAIQAQGVFLQFAVLTARGSLHQCTYIHSLHTYVQREHRSTFGNTEGQRWSP
jgi:hypothetical protein